MRFEEALKAMRKGKKVRLYDSNAIYIDKWGDIREDNPNEGYADYPVDFLGLDIMSEDWEIVDA